MLSLQCFDVRQVCFNGAIPQYLFKYFIFYDSKSGLRFYCNQSDDFRIHNNLGKYVQVPETSKFTDLFKHQLGTFTDPASSDNNEVGNISRHRNIIVLLIFTISQLAFCNSSRVISTQDGLVHKIMRNLQPLQIRMDLNSLRLNI